LDYINAFFLVKRKRCRYILVATNVFTKWKEESNDYNDTRNVVIMHFL